VEPRSEHGTAAQTRYGGRPRAHALGSHFDAFLLPVYEAGSNAIHALLDRYGGSKIATEGKLIFAFSIGTNADEFAVTVSDNVR
jgi:hypothetical protein